MENKLTRLDEFKDILDHYQISPENKEILQKTKLVLMLGPSSTGRNTIIKEMLKTGEYHFLVSDTTRNKRANDGVMEEDGVSYWFRSEEDFLSDLKEGRYLEAELIHNQQVSGIGMRELSKASEQNKIAITDVDLKGVEVIIAAKPETITLLVLPPTFEVWQNRLNGRGKLPDAEIRRRLETAVKILEAGLTASYFYYVINDEFHKSVGLIHDIIQYGPNVEEQERGKQVINKLLTDTKDFLKN